jgi:hypothetical protein
LPKELKVLKIENPHFLIILSEHELRIDVKGTFKNEVEESLETQPVLKETIGKLINVFVPLHIRLSEIDSVQLEDDGKVQLNIPYSRDIVIPFENLQNARTFVEKLKESILDAKLEQTKEHVEALHAEEEIKKKREKHKEKLNEKKYKERSHEIFKP